MFCRNFLGKDSLLPFLTPGASQASSQNQGEAILGASEKTPTPIPTRVVALWSNESVYFDEASVGRCDSA